MKHRNHQHHLSYSLTLDLQLGMKLSYSGGHIENTVHKPEAAKKCLHKTKDQKIPCKKLHQNIIS